MRRKHRGHDDQLLSMISRSSRDEAQPMKKCTVLSSSGPAAVGRYSRRPQAQNYQLFFWIVMIAYIIIIVNFSSRRMKSPSCCLQSREDLLSLTSVCGYFAFAASTTNVALITVDLSAHASIVLKESTVWVNATVSNKNNSTNSSGGEVGGGVPPVHVGVELLREFSNAVPLPFGFSCDGINTLDECLKEMSKAPRRSIYRQTLSSQSSSGSGDCSNSSYSDCLFPRASEVSSPNLVYIPPAFFSEIFSVKTFGSFCIGVSGECVATDLSQLESTSNAYSGHGTEGTSGGISDGSIRNSFFNNGGSGLSTPYFYTPSRTLVLDRSLASGGRVGPVDTSGSSSTDNAVTYREETAFAYLAVEGSGAAISNALLSSASPTQLGLLTANQDLLTVASIVFGRSATPGAVTANTMRFFMSRPTRDCRSILVSLSLFPDDKNDVRGSWRGSLFGTDGSANSLWWRRVMGVSAEMWFRLLSPFALFPTFAGVLLGNIVATVTLFFLSLVVLPLYKLARPKRTWLDCCCICRFPSVTVGLMYNLLCGTAVAAAAIISSLWHDLDDDIANLIASGFGSGGPLADNDSVQKMGAKEHPAIIVLAFLTGLFVIGLPFGVYYGCRHYFAPMRFVKIKAATGRITGFMLPSGQIQPYPARTAFVNIVGDTNRQSTFWSALPSLLPLWLFVMYLASSTFCAVFVLLAMVGVIAQLALIAHFKPYFTRARNFFESMAMLCVAICLMFLSLSLWSVENMHKLAESEAERTKTLIELSEPRLVNASSSSFSSEHSTIPSSTEEGVKSVANFFTTRTQWANAISLIDNSSLFVSPSFSPENEGIGGGGGWYETASADFPNFDLFRDALARSVIGMLVEPTYFDLKSVFNPIVIILTLLVCVRIPNILITFLALDDPWRTKWDQPGSDEFGLSNVLWTRLAPSISSALFMYLKKKRKRPTRTYRRGKFGKKLREEEEKIKLERSMSRSRLLSRCQSHAQEQEPQPQTHAAAAPDLQHTSIIIGDSQSVLAGAQGVPSPKPSTRKSVFFANDLPTSPPRTHQDSRHQQHDTTISQVSPIPVRRNSSFSRSPSHSVDQSRSFSSHEEYSSSISGGGDVAGDDGWGDGATTSARSRPMPTTNVDRPRLEEAAQEGVRGAHSAVADDSIAPFIVAVQEQRQREQQHTSELSLSHAAKRKGSRMPLGASLSAAAKGKGSPLTLSRKPSLSPTAFHSSAAFSPSSYNPNSNNNHSTSSSFSSAPNVAASKNNSIEYPNTNKDTNTNNNNRLVVVASAPGQPSPSSAMSSPVTAASTSNGEYSTFAAATNAVLPPTAIHLKHNDGLTQSSRTVVNPIILDSGDEGSVASESGGGKRAFSPPSPHLSLSVKEGKKRKKLLKKMMEEEEKLIKKEEKMQAKKDKAMVKEMSKSHKHDGILLTVHGRAASLASISSLPSPVRGNQNSEEAQVRTTPMLASFTGDTSQKTTVPNNFVQNHITPSNAAVEQQKQVDGDEETSIAPPSPSSRISTGNSADDEKNGGVTQNQSSTLGGITTHTVNDGTVAVGHSWSREEATVTATTQRRREEVTGSGVEEGGASSSRLAPLSVHVGGQNFIVHKQPVTLKVNPRITHRGEEGRGQSPPYSSSSSSSSSNSPSSGPPARGQENSSQDDRAAGDARLPTGPTMSLRPSPPSPSPSSSPSPHPPLLGPRKLAVFPSRGVVLLTDSSDSDI